MIFFIKKITKSILYFLSKLKNRKIILKISKNSDVMLHRVSGYADCQLAIGSESIVSSFINFDRSHAIVSIGDRTFIGKSHIVCAQNINIGNDVLISWGCTIVDHNSHSVMWEFRSKDVKNWRIGVKDWQNVVCTPVNIMNKAWIGFNAVILKGVTIGEGAVVGAGSIVTKDVPPWTIVAGNPAQIIRELTLEERQS